MANIRRITKSNDKCIAGVCGGFAEFYDLDPTIVRIGYAAISIFSSGFPGLLLYIVMACVMPESDKRIEYTR